MKTNARRDAEVRTTNLTTLVNATTTCVFIYREQLAPELFDRLQFVQSQGKLAVEEQTAATRTVADLEPVYRQTWDKFESLVDAAKYSLVACTDHTLASFDSLPKTPVELATVLAPRLREISGFGAQLELVLQSSLVNVLELKQRYDAAVRARDEAELKVASRLLSLRGVVLDARGELKARGITLLLPKPELTAAAKLKAQEKAKARKAKKAAEKAAREAKVKAGKKQETSPPSPVSEDKAPEKGPANEGSENTDDKAPAATGDAA